MNLNCLVFLFGEHVAEMEPCSKSSDTQNNIHITYVYSYISDRDILLKFNVTMLLPTVACQEAPPPPLRLLSSKLHILMPAACCLSGGLVGIRTGWRRRSLKGGRKRDQCQGNMGFLLSTPPHSFTSMRPYRHRVFTAVELRLRPTMKSL